MLGACRRRGRRTLVGLGVGTALAGASVVRAETRCRLDVQVEGAPDGQALAGRLRQEAERGQACSRPWTLRVSPGPRGQFIVALWNGSTLESRWASNTREIEPVASLLMRVAVERAMATEPPAPPATSEGPREAGPAPSADGGPRETGPAPTGSGAPVEGGIAPMEDPGRYTIAASVGPAWSDHASGGGVEGRVAFTLGGAHLRAGLASHLARFSGDARRTDLGVEVTGLVQTSPSRAWRLGLGVEVGGGVQSAEATVGGQSASKSAVGFEVGAAPFVGRRLGASWWLTASVPVRLSTASAVAKGTTTTTTPGKSGEAPGNGAGKDKTTTTPPTQAEIRAADALGGVTAALLLGLAYEF